MGGDPLSLWLRALSSAPPPPGEWPGAERALLAWWDQQESLAAQLAAAAGGPQAAALAAMAVELWLSPLRRQHAWLAQCAPLPRSLREAIGVANDQWWAALTPLLAGALAAPPGAPSRRGWRGLARAYQRAVAAWRAGLRDGSLRGPAQALGQALLSAARRPVEAGDGAAAGWLPLRDGPRPLLLIAPPDWPAPAVAEAATVRARADSGLVVFDWGDLAAADADADALAAQWRAALGARADWPRAPLLDASGLGAARFAGAGQRWRGLPAGYLAELPALAAAGRFDPLWLAVMADIWSPEADLAGGAERWRARRARLAALPAVGAGALAVMAAWRAGG